MRGVSLCLGEQVLDAARSQAGKGAVHQLRVSHSCEMQMERHLPPSLPPSTAGVGRSQVFSVATNIAVAFSSRHFTEAEQQFKSQK